MVREEKRLPDTIMYGQKFRRKLVKPLRKEKKQQWAKEEPKLDTAGRIFFSDPDDEEYQEIIRMRRASASGRGHAVLKEIHKATSGTISTKKPRRPHCMQREKLR